MRAENPAPQDEEDTDYADRDPAPVPTPYEPQTASKVTIMAQRVAAGFSPFNPSDAPKLAHVFRQARHLLRRCRQRLREQLKEAGMELRDGPACDAKLAELRGMPQDEIARHLGSNRNALYKLTHDARKRLKRGLEAAGFTAEDIGAAFAG